MIWIAPFFNALTGTQISTSFITHPLQILIYLLFVSLILAVTLLFVLYRIRSTVYIDVLKPSSGKTGKRVQLPAFNIFQLAGSVALIVCSIIIIKQISFIANKPIGLNKEVIEVKIPAAYGHISSVFKEELINNPSIEIVSAAESSPVLGYYMVLLDYEEDGVKKEYTPAGFSGDEHYISTLGIEILEGADFTDNPKTNQNKIFINQSLAKLFPGQNLIGEGLPGMEKSIVTGIVKDFHYANLKKVVQPAFIRYNSKGRHLMVKTAVNKQKEARALIAQVWDKLIPDYPLNYQTIGDRYEWMHQENKNYIRLIGACCCISIFLSMIGLFAISYQTSQYRTKEIGIRKVNGAKVAEILGMLNKDFIKWVAIAFTLACPIAYYAMYKWLENFAYKTTLSWWIFTLAGVLALAIALLTVSWQSWRAATRNPVEALRYE